MADPFPQEGIQQALAAIAAAIKGKLQVSTFTNTGTGGGSGYYLDTGAGNVKFAWGRSTALTPGGAGGQAAFTVVLPSGLFTNPPQDLGLPGELTIQGDQQVFENAAPTTTLLTYALRQATAGVGATGKVIWFAIGN